MFLRYFIKIYSDRKTDPTDNSNLKAYYYKTFKNIRKKINQI